MPTNLNALIRYRTIDKVLRNRYVKATIEKLIDECSSNLYEYQGRVLSISERTIRDDIRVMRSGALGYEAPIMVKDGVYFYEDDKFNIFTEKIYDKQLLIDIFNMLIQEKDNLLNAGLQDVLDRICEITGLERVIIKPEIQKKEEKLIENDEISDEDSDEKISFSISFNEDNTKDEDVNNIEICDDISYSPMCENNNSNIDETKGNDEAEDILFSPSIMYSNPTIYWNDIYNLLVLLNP